MKIGLFGGTFNPPHKTHVNIARQAKRQLGLDKLLAVPCGDPPHKACDVDKLTRLCLTRLAFDGIAETWDYEVRKEDKSYTVETLREAKRLYPNDELYLVIGGDSLQNFHKWYCPNEIADLATIAVAARANELPTDIVDGVIRQFNAKVVVLDVEPNGISSSEIRLRYQFGWDNGEYVPEAVNKYVKEHGLYSKYRQMVDKLKTYLTEQRFKHTFYVVKRGLELCNDEERDDVFVACLLHDCAKYIDEKDYAKYRFVAPAGMPKPVIHSFLGAYVANMDFGIDLEAGGKSGSIISAISYHTTGRPNMSRLEKIVYIADKTEETRPYPLEHLLDGTLDEMFLKCLFEANEYREQAHGDSDFALTDLTLKYYKGELKIEGSN